MPEYQLFRPKTPGASRSEAETFSGTSDQIEAMKKGGQDLSYSLKGEAQGGGPPPPAPGVGGIGGDAGVGGAVTSPEAPGLAQQSPAMTGLQAQQPQPGIPAQPMFGATTLRPELGTRTPPPLAGLLQYKVY